MYSHGSVPVDKGLGFDFSGIADLVKAALPVTLSIFNNQQQLKQIKAGVQINPYNNPYGLQAGQLPLAAQFGVQPTLGNQMQYAQPGMSTTTMALLGAGALIVGLIALKALR